MNLTQALLSQRYWSRADAPARSALLSALRGLEVGQRLRLADVLAAPPAAEGEAADTERAAPALCEFVSVSLRAKGVDTETRECELSFSSEEPYERWWGIEVLGHKGNEVDMGWMASGRAPLLSNHDSRLQIGVITRAWLQGSKGRAVVRFGKSELAEQEMQDAADAVRVNVSVGYEIRELELVKKEGDTSTYRVTDWMPLECSLVSIPADMTVGVGRSASLNPTAPATVSPQPRQSEPSNMTTTTTEAPKTGDEQFRANVRTIGLLATAYAAYIKPDDMARAIADGADPEKFNELVMQRMQSGATDVTTSAALGLTSREKKRYSFMRALQSQIPGTRIDAGLEHEISRAIAQQVGREAEGIFIPSDIFAGQQRDFTAGTAAEAGNLIQTEVMGSMFTDILRPALVFAQLGATVLPGLTSNVSIPRKNVAGTLAMLSEIAAASETQPGTTVSTLSPKRVAAYTDPSKQAIIQGELGVEAMIRDDLVTGGAQMVENMGINGSGSSNQPRGIRNVSGIGSVVGGTNGANFVWSHATGLEAACANANAGMTTRAGYLLNTKTKNTCKNTQKAANLPFIWDNGDTPLNGYRAGVTNNMPSNLTKGTSSGVCSSVAFSADWSMFVLGLFGGLDVTVDPYTQADKGQLRIILNLFFDWACRQPGAFAVMDDALTP
jgi:HK97 family phage major capsid protein